jgi:phosphoribosylformylglycinamidine synthase II
VEWKIEIFNKRGVFDPLGSGIKKSIHDLGISGVKKVTTAQVFVVTGDISPEDVKRIAEELLVDPVTQEYRLGEETLSPLGRGQGEGCKIVEVAYNPGVMDPVEESALKGISDLGIFGVESVKTEMKYVIEGKISKSRLNAISEKLLYNKVIQHVVEKSGMDRGVHTKDYEFKLLSVDILGADDEKLMEISRNGQLFLNLAEMTEIKKYFEKLGRNPTDCELETIAQTWSEHCAHKTFRGVIDYEETGLEGKDKILGGMKIDNLLKATIMKVTKELANPWCISVFKDNAGIIEFDKKDNICFKVETHNHPSALEPYGGAGTGIGGVIRDILGVGLGAKPILNTDVFCFGLPDTPQTNVPKGTLHPKRIMKGVVSGVRDYGNRMGIPTANGAVLFDERYIGNPLVHCGTVGIMPKDKSFKETKPGDYIVAVGGRTGRDGIHGATFSSGELTHESEEVSGGAVQIGNAITEKKVTDTLLKARDRNLYTAITDCGAGGFSSAVGEMGQYLGAEVDLEKAPLKYRGLTYTEIWISEAQERMVMSVPEKNIEELLDVFQRENVEAVIIGRFTGDKRLRLKYNGNLVCDLDMEFLHDGIPRFERPAVWSKHRHKEFNKRSPKDLTRSLLKILSCWNVCSKEWIIRQYDHEVQGKSVLKPLVGIANDGPGDAAVIRPKFDSKKGIIVSNGINFRYSSIDPYWMAASCIDEALRQVIAVGGSLEKTALLDNFCWGNTDKPDRLGDLVRASFGCYDIAKGYGVPFISGKDSLNNEYSVHGKSFSIPSTLLISAISVMDDVEKAVSMDFKDAGNLIYAVGMTYDELGGSHYNMINGAIGNNVPKVDAEYGLKVFSALSKASKSGMIRSCHDCSEGGIGVTLAEMAFAGDFGAEVFLGKVPFFQDPSLQAVSLRSDTILFSESNTRFIVEVKEKNKKKFETIMKDVPVGLMGCTSKKKDLKVYGLDNKKVIDVNISRLKEAWQKPLRW